jgi:hypothetical protein
MDPVEPVVKNASKKKMNSQPPSDNTANIWDGRTAGWTVVSYKKKDKKKKV